jgi:hypothetical protein
MVGGAGGGGGLGGALGFGGFGGLGGIDRSRDPESVCSDCFESREKFMFNLCMASCLVAVTGAAMVGIFMICCEGDPKVMIALAIVAALSGPALLVCLTILMVPVVIYLRNHCYRGQNPEQEYEGLMVRAQR